MEGESPHTSADERALVERAQRADMDAFESLYRTYVRRIHAFAYRRSGSGAVADDVTSATFERALRELASFRWRDRGFGSWLFRIAANELADHYRAEARSRSDRALAAARVLSDGASSGDFIEEDVLNSVQATRIRAALGRLNPRYQRAISLRYLAGLEHTEAARALGASKGAMAVTLHRALAALRRELDRMGESA